jgi:hypothetical protein
VKPHYFHPEAGEEYAKAAKYYATISPGLPGRFMRNGAPVIGTSAFFQEQVESNLALH